jgi:hypothetical protein
MSTRRLWFIFVLPWMVVLTFFAVVWFFTHGVVGHILSWLVVVVPVFLGLIVIVVPARLENEQKHMRWRYALGACLILYGGLAWLEQSSSESQSVRDREQAVEDTAAKTSAQVSATVGKEYQAMIDDLNSQIKSLKQQLAEQSTDFTRELMKAKSDLSGSISRVTPPENADIQFTLTPSPEDRPVMAKALPLGIDGVVSVDFQATNISNVGAASLDLWIHLCDGGGFAKEPAGFENPNGDATSVIRHRAWGDLNPQVTTAKMTVDVKLPGNATHRPFQIAFIYSCRNCGKRKEPQIATVTPYAIMRQ